MNFLLPVTNHKRDITQLGEGEALGPEPKRSRTEKYIECLDDILSSQQQRCENIFFYSAEKELSSVTAKANDFTYPFLIQDTIPAIIIPEYSLPLDAIAVINAQPIPLNENIESALDTLLLTKNATPLLSLFQKGLLFDLNTEAKNEIFDIIMSDGNRDLLLASASLNLSNNQRRALLKHALQKKINDIALVKVAINGSSEQKKLDYPEPCKNKQIFKLEKLIDRAINAEIIEYLASHSKVDKADLKDAEMRQFLSNLWGIDQGEFYINGEKIEYAGAFSYFFLDLILESLETFYTLNPTIFPFDFVRELAELIESSKVEVPSSERLKRYQAHQSVLILGGTKDHLIAFLLKDNLLMYCNKGAYSTVPVKVYEIDPSLVTEEVLTLYAESSYFLRSNGPGEKNLFGSMPSLLKGNDSTPLAKSLTEQFTQHWQSNRKQTKQNCVWESIRSAIAAFTAVQAWEKTVRDNSSILKALRQSLAWETFFLGWGLEAYLDYAANSYRIDSNLLESIFEEIASQKEKQPDLDIFKFYETLEEKYFQIKEDIEEIDIEFGDLE